VLKRFWGNVEQYAAHLPVRGSEVWRRSSRSTTSRSASACGPAKKSPGLLSPQGRFKHQRTRDAVSVTLPVVDLFETVVVEY